MILLALFQGLVHTSFMEEQSLYHLPGVLGCVSVNGATNRLLGFLKASCESCGLRISWLKTRQMSEVS